MRKHCLLVFLLLVITPIGTKRLSSAQQRQMGGVGITVFADRNFRGKSATFQEDVPDLARYDLNDRISSLRVAPGEQWEVCEHSNYQGRCAVFSGDEPRLTDSSWGDVISSLRRVGGGAVFPPGGAVPPSAPPASFSSPAASERRWCRCAATPWPSRPRTGCPPWSWWR